MARCGCAGASCACIITAGDNVTVTGSGSAGSPFVISADGVFITAGTGVTITGSGTSGDPYVISAP